ncbi:MAG: alpha/beta hydrolase [Acidobacteriia bacterium]|nr:alpha/beta hydrolase [Terriglobia bacterium]
MGTRSLKTEVDQESIGDLRIEVHKVYLSSTSAIALSHVRRKDTPLRHLPPVVLAHGVFVNRNIWLSAKGKGMAAWLARFGLDVWLLEVRGHGRASVGDPRRSKTGFDDLVDVDVRVAIETIRELTGAKKLFWVGHSHGGILIYAFLGKYHEANSLLAGVVTLGTQTTEQNKTWRQRCRLISIPVVVSLLGYFPARRLRLGPEDEFGRVMLEWFWWNWKQKWINNDFDYQSALRNISVPLLCLVGVSDDMANPEGCERIFNGVGSSDKTFCVLGRRYSNRADYDHTSIIISADAEREVWPMILQWIERRGIATSQADL